MALFQPTNILPDLLAGNGSGTVFYDPNDASAQVEISWTVNGNSPMTAYRIRFYKNNAASTNVHTTGKVTVSPAFSAVSADGTETRFSVKVPIDYLTDCADSTTGYTGKFQITQWWGSASDSESVIQRSLTVFRVNGISSLSVGYAYPNTGLGGIYNFAGTFTAPNPDHFDTSLVWTRWKIYRVGFSNPVQDTGKVWGATSYNWTCQQLLPGSYTVVMTALTSTGELLESNAFSVNFGTSDLVEMNGAISAACDKNTRSIRVIVKYSDTIQGVSAPNSDFSNYVDSNGYVVITPMATATWKIPAAASGSEWGFVWVGKPTMSGTVVTLIQDNGDSLNVSTYQGTIRVTYNGAVYQSATFTGGSTLYFYITTGTGAEADNWYFYVGQFDGSNNYSYSRVQLNGFLFNQGARVIFGATGSTGQTTNMSCRIIYGNQGPLYSQAVTGGDGSGIHNPQVIIPYTDNISYAQQGLAVIEYFGDLLRNGAVYRTENNGNPEFFANTTPFTINSEMVFNDYGVATGNTYQYFVVHQYDLVGVPTLHQTESVSPCWWEWTLIEAETDGVYGVYKEVNAYYFSMNVASGSDGNGSSPGVYSNFTPYPIVMRDTTNRHSGTLTGLIGWLGMPGEYVDTNQMREAIRALSTSKNTLFLRSRRGDLFKIAISAEITTSTEDNSPKQQISVSIPWVEIGPVDGSIVTGGLRILGGGST